MFSFTERKQKLRRDPLCFLLREHSFMMSYFLEKLVNYRIEKPVPKTDTGRLVENTEERKRTLSKELGKLAP